jgi:hypothetical protein
MLPIESFAHDRGCTLVRAENVYPKGTLVLVVLVVKV